MANPLHLHDQQLTQGRVHALLSTGATGGMVALAALAVVLTLGLVAYAPLGAAAHQGVMAAFAAVVSGGLVYAYLGRVASPSAGPSSATALIFSALVAQLAQDPQINLSHADDLQSLLAVMAFSVVLMGLFQMGLGVSGLGRLARFVPQTVLAGFMNAVALTILMSQVPQLLGLGPLEHWTEPASWSHVQPFSVAMGLATAGLVWFLNVKWPQLPATLLALVLATLVYQLFFRVWTDLPIGPTVGALPQDMALPSGLMWQADARSLLLRHTQAVVFTSMVLAVIGSLESLLVALATDSFQEVRHQPRRELLALGAANMVSGLCGGLPLTLSYSRAMILLKKGALGRGPVVATVLTFVIMAIFGGPLLAFLPHTVLAGIMLTIAVALMDRWTHQLLRQWVAGERSAEVWQSLLVVACVCVATLMMGILAGVALGGLLAMLVFIRSMNRSLVRSCLTARERPSRRIYAPALEAQLQPLRQGIVQMDLEGALFFGSGELLQAQVFFLGPECRFLVLDLRRVSTIDESGAVLLQQLSEQLQRRGVSLLLAGVSADNAHGQRLRAFGCFRSEEPGGGRADWWLDADRAVEEAERQLLQGTATLATPTTVALPETSLMRHLSAAQCFQLTTLMRQQQLAPGEFLFCQGDAGDMLYVLTQGSISIVDSRSPASQRFFSFSPGVMFGEISMLDGGRRSADARADSDVVVWSLSGEAYRALVAADPVLGVQLATNMAVHLAERLRSATSAWRASVA
jgi:SulP family sulfate permease